MDQSSSESGGAHSAGVESLFADLVARAMAGEEPDLEAICTRHPEHGDELRRRIGDWRRAGQVLERLGLEPEAGADAVAENPAALDPEVLRERTRLYSSRYTVIGEIGRGGMGTILSVRDEDLGRELAMKVLRDRNRSTVPGHESPIRPERTTRFLEEARITGRLQHPNIVPVHELGIDPEGRPYFTMKLVEGRTLREIFELMRKGEEGWNVQRALGVLLKVCDAVRFAHDKGIVHRDLKPSNLMVGSFGEVYVMDWGLARDCSRPSDTPAEVPTSNSEPPTPSPGSPTREGDVLGTPAYMAPEQALGDQDRIGPLSDVFAVGAMLYELLAGRTPYGVRSTDPPHVRLAATLRVDPPRISALVPGTPAELCAICELAIARDPAERYPSMLALARDLRAYLEGRVVKAYATGAWAEFRKWVQRNPVVGSLAGLLLVVLTAGLIALSLQKSRIQRANSALEIKTGEALANALAEKKRADEVFRLSLSQDYDDAVARAATLWPASPDRISDYREWLSATQGLVAQVPALKAKRDELRREALPPAGDPSNERLDWSFPEEKSNSRWWNNQLTKLIGELESLTAPGTGLLTKIGVSPEHGWSVPRRLAFAERLRDGLAPGGEFLERWNQALPAIRESYPSLELFPQIGLVPIGQDPISRLWEFWHVQSGYEPLRGEDGKLEMEEISGLVLVLLPGGKFWMGAQRDDPAGRNFDPAADRDEGPVHEVELSAFFLSKYEMTQGQWDRLVGHNPSNYQGSLAPILLHPVEQVSWQDCVALLSNLGLSLPSEAQWEYGARGGTDTPWWTGALRETLSEKQAANLADQAAARAGAPWTEIADWPELDDGFPVHAPVGSYTANGYGLHEIHGNVWEWCLDGYDPGFYARPAELDPVSPHGGSGARVDRGGGFSDTAVHARLANRDYYTQTGPDIALGLRPARAIE